MAGINGKEKLVLIALAIALVAAGGWAILNFAKPAQTQPPAAATSFSDAERFFADELPDKCKTPPGYTEKDWKDHLSHHPDRYAECLK